MNPPGGPFKSEHGLGRTGLPLGHGRFPLAITVFEMEFFDSVEQLRHFPQNLQFLISLEKVDRFNSSRSVLGQGRAPVPFPGDGPGRVVTSHLARSPQALVSAPSA